MCISKATVAYGLTVRSASLVFASDAWTRIAEPFTFLDLLSLRRRSNTLRARRIAISKVPEEVWEEVRSFLVLVEIANSEDRLLDPVFRTDLHDLGVRPYRTVLEWSQAKEYSYCECTCRFLCFNDWVSNHISFWSCYRVQRLNTLLSYFGLSLPLEEPIPVSSSVQGLSKAIALITAPSHFLKGTSRTPIIQAVCGGDDGPDEHTIVDLSFKLPSEIDRRFNRFIRLFDLEVVESSINKISSCPSEKVSVKGAEGTKEEREEKKNEVSSETTNGVKDEVTKVVKPRWIVWTKCEAS
ncbi:hypothetical protein JCM16303_002812 [Sporobolomyces ruberrimus]